MRGQTTVIRTLNAQYSRKSDPKNEDNVYKVVKARVRLEGELGAKSNCVSLSTMDIASPTPFQMSPDV